MRQEKILPPDGCPYPQIPFFPSLPLKFDKQLDAGQGSCYDARGIFNLSILFFGTMLSNLKDRTLVCDWGQTG